jgi:hypothetical protein
MEFCSCRSGQALTSTSTIIRACPRHTYVRECKAQVGIRGIVLPPPQGKRTKDSTDDRKQPQWIEIKLDRLIDDVRLLRSQMIAFDRQLIPSR